ncbi:MAG TPA: TIGR03118 family protein, partial [Gemmatimonadales bacterium]|nr:TIGR03118 family protein [Gemmatimonadales bacterium]
MTALAALGAFGWHAALGAGYLQSNLAADQPGVALVHDPELIDAWGIAINPTGTFWLSARATDVSTVYSGDVTRTDGTRSPFVKSTLTVTIPGGRPTGQVFNGSNDFVVTSGTFSAPARFIFASDTGHITGWNAAVPPPVPSRSAHLKATTPGAVYTGLAIGNNGSGNLLYAADF